MWKLSADGFVMQYMVTRPVIEDYASELKGKNQLELEGLLRREIVKEKKEYLSEMSDRCFRDYEGEAWQVYAPFGANMIDLSDFYSTLKRIEINAAAVVMSPKEMPAHVRIWSYMAAGVYLNGKLAGEIALPRYKPINYTDIFLTLREGENHFVFVCENLGVRDSRNILGMQFLGGGVSDLEVTLPKASLRESVFQAKLFLDSLKIEDDGLTFEGPISMGSRFREYKRELDYEIHALKKPREYPITKGQKISVPKAMTSVCVEVKGQGFLLSRILEFERRIIPEYFADDRGSALHLKSKNNYNAKNYFGHIKRIAQVGSNNRSHFGFCMPNILARKELEAYGIQYERPNPSISDRQRLFTMLDLVEQRVDCSDFELCGLFRYLRFYEEEVDESLSRRIRNVLLNFRYWMDMDGSDGMCFWSENHSLMFYYAAMEAGNRYPDAWFPLAKRRGKDLATFGEEHIEDWIRDVEEYGFEEFQSAVYLCVTLAVMLNIIDFSKEPLSERMRHLCDKMLIQLAMQTFDSVEVSPMGRVYRNVLYPFSQGTQSLLDLMIEGAPVSYGEGWIAFLHGSDYRFPEAMHEYVNKPLDTVYSTGNALIYTKKTKEFCLTSVASPRKDGVNRWENIRENADLRSSHPYTKSINESFHGTSFFEPGTHGYQQHMWSAALSREAIFFVNHPGASNEQSAMRPGYWFGNGIMPAVLQDNKRNMLGSIYHIPEDHPIKFTHLYLPRSRFDRVVFDGRWIFVQAGNGLSAIWCSEILVPCNDMLFECEMRANSRDSAYFVLCAGLPEYGALEDFIAYAKGIGPAFEYTYDSHAGYEARLWLQGKEFLKWEKGSDATQVIQ